MPSHTYQFHLRRQQRLIAFLHAELDLAFALLQACGIQEDNFDSALESARDSLDVVRSLVLKVEDAASLLAIEERAAEYETAMRYLLRIFRAAA